MITVIKNSKRTGLRETAKHEKQRRILQAAEALFKTKGFENTTTKEVAERAKIATGTLFLYAKDKNDLLLWVYSQKIGATVADIAARRSGPRKKTPGLSQWQNEAISFFEPFFRLYSKDRATARQFVKEQIFASGDRGMKERVDFLALICEYLQQGKEAGHVRGDVDPMAFAGTMFAVYFLHLGQWLQTGGEVEPRLQALQDHIEKILKGAY